MAEMTNAESTSERNARKSRTGLVVSDKMDKTVVVAIELLGTGEPGAGALMAAVGVGAVAGSLAASFLVGSGRLGGWFALGVALWGLPVTLIGVLPHQVMALLMLACVGVGNSLIDLAGFTLLARLAGWGGPLPALAGRLAFEAVLQRASDDLRSPS